MLKGCFIGYNNENDVWLLFIKCQYHLKIIRTAEYTMLYFAVWYIVIIFAAKLKHYEYCYWKKTRDRRA